MQVILNERRTAPRRRNSDFQSAADGARSYARQLPAAEALRRHAGVAVTVFILSVAAGVAYLLLARPVYQADALLQVGSATDDVLLAPLHARGGDEGEPPPVSGEIEILRARETIVPAIVAHDADLEVRATRLGLLPFMPAGLEALAASWGVLPLAHPEGVRVTRLQLPQQQRGLNFVLAVDASRWTLTDEDERQVAAGATGTPVQFSVGGDPALIEVAAAPGAPRSLLVVRRAHMLVAYHGLLKRLRAFEPSRESGVVRVSLEDHDPVRAAGLLNDIVDRYIARSLARNTDAGAHALAVLDQQLPQIERRVELAEEALSRFQKGATAIPLTTEAEALLRHAGELDHERVLLQVKRDQLGQQLGSNHPQVTTVLAQLETVERSIRRIDAKVNRMPVQQRDSLRLQRDVQVNTEMYTATLGLAQQLRVAQAGRQPSARLIDAAAVPVIRASPRPVPVLSASVGLGLVMALASILLARSLRSTVADVQDIEDQVGLPTFAVIPYTPQQRRLMRGRLRAAAEDGVRAHRLLARADPTDPAVEGLRGLHLALAVRTRGAPAKAILVTSPTAGAGKTFVACNTAALMAAAGRRVLLLETDLRRSSVHRYIGLDRNGPGLSDVLELGYPVDDVIQTDVVANLDVIVHGTVRRNPAGLLLSVAMEELVAALRERYDCIVIDSAPLLPVGDALAVARLADVALIVVRAEESSAREAYEAVRRLNVAGLAVDGLVLNGVKGAGYGAAAYAYGVPATRAPSAWQVARADDAIIDLSRHGRH